MNIYQFSAVDNIAYLVTLWSTLSTDDALLVTFSFTNIIPVELRPDLHRLKKATRSPANKHQVTKQQISLYHIVRKLA